MMRGMRKEARSTLKVVLLDSVNQGPRVARLTLPVEFVAFGTLPRFELKAKRWLDLRKER